MNASTASPRQSSTFRWDIKGCVRSDVDVLAECKESARVRTRSPDSLVLSISRQLAVGTQGRQSLQLSAGGRGKFAGRNTSERRYSIVISTSDHADSAGDFPGASMSLGSEACYRVGHRHVARTHGSCVPSPKPLAS
jgi:hypothetical protein